MATVTWPNAAATNNSNIGDGTPTERRASSVAEIWFQDDDTLWYKIDNTWRELTGYIANAVTEKTVDAAELVSGVLANARISEGNITQHQAALSIAIAQITGNIPNAKITQSSVKQHEAALAITKAQIPGALLSEFDIQTGTTYSGISLTDAGKGIAMLNASANNVVIPQNADIAFPIFTPLHFMQWGTGTTTIAIAGDTLNHSSSRTPVLTGQYSVATAIKMAATQWVLFGDLQSV